jgi:RNA polymerase sigma factor (sigma-70 family)
MPKLTHADLNRLHAEFVADPNGKADRFWSAVRDWVVRCDYLMPPSHKQDLVQDTIVELMTHLDRFKPGLDFVNWANAIIRNMRMDCFSDHFYDREEVSFCELASTNDEGEVAEYDPGTDIDGVDDPDDWAPKGDREDAAVVKLYSVRAGLKKQADIDLFDLLREGKSMSEVAGIIGQPFRTVQSRFHAMKKKVERKPNPLLCFGECNSRGTLQRAA